MSNDFAIATVTAAICGRIRMATGEDNVEKVNPRKFEGLDNQSRINVFLYQAMPNTSMTLSDLPTRTADGKSFTARPQLALNLNYLITFLSDDQLLAQRQLALVLLDFVSSPALSKTLIAEVIGTKAFGLNSELDPGEIDHQAARLAELPVRITRDPLTVDEMQKLWSMFFQVSYRLSVAVSASFVLLEADLAAKRVSPPRSVLISSPDQTRFMTQGLASGTAASRPLSLQINRVQVQADKKNLLFEFFPAAAEEQSAFVLFQSTLRRPDGTLPAVIKSEHNIKKDVTQIEVLLPDNLKGPCTVVVAVDGQVSSPHPFVVDRQLSGAIL